MREAKTKPTVACANGGPTETPVGLEAIRSEFISAHPVFQDTGSWQREVAFAFCRDCEGAPRNRTFTLAAGAPRMLMRIKFMRSAGAEGRQRPFFCPR